MESQDNMQGGVAATQAAPQEEAAVISDLPDVGDWVIYWPRAGEVRRGRTRLPALVIHRHEDERRLDLVVVMEANDVINQERIPERVGEERGWTAKAPATITGAAHDDSETAELRREIAGLRTLVVGEFDEPDSPILDLIDSLDRRLDALERPKAPAKAPAKKGKKRK